MQNIEGKLVDLYIPRKCSATKNLIGASDHASIQIDVADVDRSTGVMIPDHVKSYVFCGSVRAMGETDDSLNRLATEDGILHNVYEKKVVAVACSREMADLPNPHDKQVQRDLMLASYWIEEHGPRAVRNGMIHAMPHRPLYYMCYGETTSVAGHRQAVAKFLEAPPAGATGKDRLMYAVFRHALTLVREHFYFLEEDAKAGSPRAFNAVLAHKTLLDVVDKLMRDEELDLEDLKKKNRLRNVVIKEVPRVCETFDREHKLRLKTVINDHIPTFQDARRLIQRYEDFTSSEGRTVREIFEERMAGPITFGNALDTLNSAYLKLRPKNEVKQAPKQRINGVRLSDQRVLLHDDVAKTIDHLIVHVPELVGILGTVAGISGGIYTHTEGGRTKLQLHELPDISQLYRPMKKFMKQRAKKLRERMGAAQEHEGEGEELAEALRGLAVKDDGKPETAKEAFPEETDKPPTQ